MTRTRYMPDPNHVARTSLSLSLRFAAATLLCSHHPGVAVQELLVSWMKRAVPQMGRPPAQAGPSRGSKAAGQLSEVDLQVYQVIKESGNVGVWTRDIKYKAGITDNQVKKSINSLLQHQKIKAVHNISNPNKKMFMLIELEPSEEVSGGKWYSGKDFDNDLVANLKMVCLKFVAQQKVATLESITDFIKKSGMMNVEFQTKEIKQVVDALILERDLEEVVSTGTGIFSSVPVRKVCYRFCKKGAPEHSPFVRVPCGVCPVIHECTPDGIISPKTCLYYDKWLDF